MSRRSAGRARTTFVTACISLVVLASGTANAGQNETFGAEPFPSVIAGEARRAFAVPERVAPGIDIEESVRVYNRTDEPIRLAIYPTTARLGDDEVIEIGDRGATSPLVERITLARQSVVLQPHADATIAMRVTMAGGIAPGSLAAIVVQGAPSAGSAEFDLVQRIAILVRASGNAAGRTERSAGGVPGWLDVAIGVALLASYRWRRHVAATAGPV
jgi:hypothetical protein